jgi:hypothetical protein
VALSITTSSLPDEVVQQNYSQALQATGGQAPYTWTKTAGDLPSGLSLSSGGAITGTPAADGTYTFTVKVEDSTTPTKQSATKELSIKILSIKSNSGTTGTTCLFSDINLCQGQPVKVSGGKLVPDAAPVCGVSSCGQFLPAINAAAAKTGISANLLKATMYKESGCQIGAISPPGADGERSYGLMQMKVGTAGSFADRCGIPKESINTAWLTNQANANAIVCLAAYFYKSLADGGCGNSSRNILAGYSGGTTACQASVNCSKDTSCSGEAVRKWECLYDDNAHTVCNGNNTVIGPDSKYNETRGSVANKLYCVDHPGF